MIPEAIYIDDFDECWESLRELVISSGIRFTTHQAFRPERTYSCVDGTTPGIYPLIGDIFKEIKNEE